jgi:hypothetical protein
MREAINKGARLASKRQKWRAPKKIGPIFSVGPLEASLSLTSRKRVGDLLMTRKDARPKAATPTDSVLEAKHPSREEGRLRLIGGSHSDEFNNVVANQAIQTLWTKNSDDDQVNKQRAAVLGALVGTSPRDELEGMLAAQLIAAHNAAMECFRRAMLGEQTFEGRRESLSQANKLSRTYAVLIEALNRHRGKGQQKVTVEHVHVHSGGQAIVGAVEQNGGGVARENEGQPHAKALTHAPVAPLWSEDPFREPLPVGGDAERPLPDARGQIARSPHRKGER